VLKLKLTYFDYVVRSDGLYKRLMFGMRNDRRGEVDRGGAEEWMTMKEEAGVDRGGDRRVNGSATSTVTGSSSRQGGMETFGQSRHQGTTATRDDKMYSLW